MLVSYLQLCAASLCPTGQSLSLSACLSGDCSPLRICHICTHLCSSFNKPFPPGHRVSFSSPNTISASSSGYLSHMTHSSCSFLSPKSLVFIFIFLKSNLNSASSRSLLWDPRDLLCLEIAHLPHLSNYKKHIFYSHFNVSGI